MNVDEGGGRKGDLTAKREPFDGEVENRRKSNDPISEKRSRSNSGSISAGKRSRIEKTCEKCFATFDQIFDFQSHLVSCLNKTR